MSKYALCGNVKLTTINAVWRAWRCVLERGHAEKHRNMNGDEW